MQVAFNKRRFKSIAIFFTILFISVSSIAGQEPDWNAYPDAKDRLTAMQKYGHDLIKKQQFDQAILVLNKGLKISKQASLDSFACVFSYTIALGYRYKSNFDSSFYYLENAKIIAVQKKYINLQALIQIESYAIFNRMGKADSAAVFVDRMMDLLPLLDSNSDESGKIQLYLGHNDKHKAKYTESLTHYYKALRAFGYQKDSVNEGVIYISLANVLVILGQQDKALVYHQQAAELFTLMGRRYELMNELLNITDMYYTSNRLDSAEQSARQALSISEVLNDKMAQSFAYIQLGNIYKLRKTYTAAENYFIQSIHIGEALHNNNTLIESYKGLGETFMAEQQPIKAKPWLEKHLQLSKQEKDIEEIIESSVDLAANANALHDYASAYAYQKLYSEYKDSAYTEATSKSMAEMESKYQTEKKEKEISLLKKDQQLDRLSLQKQKNFKLVAIIFLLLLLLIGFLVINRYRVLQRAKRLIDIERLRNTIARDLHDDIGSTLSSINILSKVALQHKPNRDELMDSNMQKIKERSSSIMESMGDIVWAINPQNDTIEQMISRMKEFAGGILEPLNINYDFKEQGDFSGMKMDVKKRKDFYLLFKEAINNAAKYSHCKNLHIRLQQDQQLLHLEVVDDGIGFNDQETKNGNGLGNMRERAAALGGKIYINTIVGKGTGIVLDMPIT
jgi:two-component system sensor histidine kinase UhpB